MKNPKKDKVVERLLKEYGKTLTDLGRADFGLNKKEVDWAIEEYKEWMKQGWHGKRKEDNILFIDFPQYLKNKYK